MHVLPVPDPAPAPCGTSGQSHRKETVLLKTDADKDEEGQETGEKKDFSLDDIVF